jgi:hypothetical protein
MIISMIGCVNVDSCITSMVSEYQISSKRMPKTCYAKDKSDNKKLTLGDLGTWQCICYLEGEN